MPSSIADEKDASFSETLQPNLHPPTPTARDTILGVAASALVGSVLWLVSFWGRCEVLLQRLRGLPGEARTDANSDGSP